MKYRKKPVIVEAMQWTCDAKPMESFLEANLVPWFTNPNIIDLVAEEAINIRNKCCKRNDWVVKGPSGTVYVVDQDDFQDTYESIP